MTTKRPADHDGPHLKPPHEQRRCTVVGRTLAGDTCSVIAIADGRAGVVLYPHGAAGMGVRLTWADWASLSGTVGTWAA